MQLILPMISTSKLLEEVRDGWSAIPAPPAEDMEYMDYGWGEEAARAFIGVEPVDVDISSVGFYAATPLLDIPPRAAAAYLGTFLLSLLKGIELQESIGLFTDILSRAHTLTCLESPSFWQKVIRPHLPPNCQKVLIRVVNFLIAKAKALALTEDQKNIMLTLTSER